VLARDPDLTVDLFGMPFYRGTGERLLDHVLAEPSDRPLIVTTMNMQHLSVLRRDPSFRDVLSRTDVATADGAPIAWLARALDMPVQRVAGADVVKELIGSLGKSHLRVFLLGSDWQTLEAVANIAAASGWPLAGYYSPTPEEVAAGASSDALCERVNAAQPEIVLLLLGVPKQDRWAVEHRDHLRCRTILGAGGALDFIAGTKRRAPAIVQRIGLEWLFRLLQDPARLWRRYLVEYWYGVAMLISLTRRWRAERPGGRGAAARRGGRTW
jgi:N-acetylglucosaminyldiphosphoundecaprenol N-acetyl-beta-D-mannosaminyltransferase